MLVEVSKINKQEVTVVSSLDVAETFRNYRKSIKPTPQFCGVDIH